jgi:hypothetical protein
MRQVAALIKRTFFANERGGCARKDPYVIVGGLLTDYRSDHACDTAEFRVQDKVDSFAFGSSDS